MEGLCNEICDWDDLRRRIDPVDRALVDAFLSILALVDEP